MTVADILKGWHPKCAPATDDFIQIITSCITNLRPSLTTLAVIIFVLGWIWAGVKLIFGGFTNSSKWDEAKRVMIWTTLGFALFLLADVVVSFVWNLLTTP